MACSIVSDVKKARGLSSRLLDLPPCVGVIQKRGTLSEVPLFCASGRRHAGGRLIVIDGGFARAYQKTTGIAGYTLVQNSNGFLLSAHDAFTTRERAIAEELDIKTIPVQEEPVKNRIRNKDTDAGRIRENDIENLKLLLAAYKAGLIKPE